MTSAFTENRTVATEILLSVYGYPVTSANDPFVHIVETAISNFSRAALPASESDNYFTCYRLSIWGFGV
jgi:hypothetical protein